MTLEPGLVVAVIKELFNGTITPRTLDFEYGGLSVEHIVYLLSLTCIAQILKYLPALLETLAQSLGQEDPLKKEMATHSSVLAWEIPWTET